MDFNNESDPLRRWFPWAFRAPSGVVTAVTVIAINIPILAAAVVYNVWRSTPEMTGLWADFGWWTFQFTSFPATIYALFWLPRGLGEVARRLEENEVFEVSDIHKKVFWRENFERFRNWANNKGVVVSGIIVIPLLMWRIWLPLQRSMHSWVGGIPWMTSYLFLVWYFVFFVGYILFFRGIVAVYWINNIFARNGVRLQVLHEDGAGGVSSLGWFSVRIGYFVALYGLALAFGTISGAHLSHTGYLSYLAKEPLNLTMVALYFGLAPMLFFLPMGAAHDAMQNSKRAYIQRISRDHSKTLADLKLGDDSKVTEDKAAPQKLRDLESLYDVAKRFPVWPFNTENLVRFSVAILVPVIVAVLSSAATTVLGLK